MASATVLCSSPCLTNLNRSPTRPKISLSTATVRTAGQMQCSRPTRSMRLHAAESQELPVEKSVPSLEAAMDIEAIKQLLPHRYPFLLVDRVVELEKQNYAVGYKNVTVNDNFFPGHFPERAIMPGVLQIEALAQLGGIVMMDPEDQDAKQNFFFGGIDGCKFRRPVVPGDTLMMRVELTKFNKRFGVAKMSAKGYVGEALAVEAQLTLVMG
mmetsp:Transcript_26920/g.63900  ORF Transcript_26920/g.63900 Transcript_26920/m.63900 type:complete len:212 (-) Transcript_26920:1494-2129(-)